MKDKAFCWIIILIVFMFLVLGLAVYSFSADGTIKFAWDGPGGQTGFIFYQGTSPGKYDTKTDIGNPATYTVAGLQDGTYYFAITAYDSSKLESIYSNEVCAVVRTAWIPSIRGCGIAPTKLRIEQAVVTYTPTN